MRFLCRIGIHKWGKWSREWFITHNYTGYAGYMFTKYFVYRSLECSCCGHRKRKLVEKLSSLGPDVGVVPVWD